MKLRLLLVDAPDLKERTDNERIFQFNEFPVTIGRGANNNISLTDPTRTVSRNHVHILDKKDEVIIKDLESKNFTYLNNKRLAPNEEYALKEKDKIHCGDFILKVDILNVYEGPTTNDYTSSETQVVMDRFITTPFDEIVDNFLRLLQELTLKYNEADPAVRDALLAHAISTTAKDLEKSSEVVQLLAESISKTGLFQNVPGLPLTEDD